METKSKKRKLTGRVVGDAMSKTRVVEVVRMTKHRKYFKYYKVTKRFKAHDEKNEYRTGDAVVIEETRSLSKEKRWIIVARIEDRGLRMKETHKEKESPQSLILNSHSSST